MEIVEERNIIAVEFSHALDQLNKTKKYCEYFVLKFTNNLN